jgi:hypothetical protein
MAWKDMDPADRSLLEKYGYSESDCVDDTINGPGDYDLEFIKYRLELIGQRVEFRTSGTGARSINPTESRFSVSDMLGTPVGSEAAGDVAAVKAKAASLMGCSQEEAERRFWWGIAAYLVGMRGQ